jgi:DNA-binding Lrp family transcriptional regulator
MDELDKRLLNLIQSEVPVGLRPFAAIVEIAKETGVSDRKALISTKEYKKSRVQYFTDAEAAWEAQLTA